MKADARTESQRIAGFTLLELAVVLVILGLLTGVVAVSLSGVVREQRLVDRLEAITAWDAAVRRHAARSESGIAVEFEPVQQGAGQITASFLEDRHANSRRWLSPHIHGYRELAQASGWHTRPVVWQLSRDGVGPSLALHMINSNADRSDYVTVAGLTGQVFSTSSEETPDAIADAIEAARPDAR